MSGFRGLIWNPRGPGKARVGGLGIASLNAGVPDMDNLLRADTVGEYAKELYFNCRLANRLQWRSVIYQFTMVYIIYVKYRKFRL